MPHGTLSSTNVTDAGLKELAGLKSLTALHLGGTQVTAAGSPWFFILQEQPAEPRRVWHAAELVWLCCCGLRVMRIA